MRATLKTLFTTLSALALSSNAIASTQTCRIKPTNILTDRGGGVYLSGNVIPSGSLSFELICNVNATWHSITPDACKNWVASAVTAQATGAIIFIYFDDSENGGITDCSLFPGWSQPYFQYLGTDTT